MNERRIDPFFYKQPPLLFIDELRKPLHSQKPEWFGRKQVAEAEVSVIGAYLKNLFPDTEGLLDTAIEDFQKYLNCFNIAGERYPIILQKAATACFEAYRITIDSECCIISAEDTEGVRRALIYLEDEMQRREGPILPKGDVSKKPKIQSRITRGFYSPTNRPPKCIDELLDDVDYYPEEYLNRLAHDGTNGLWIYTEFKKLLPSDYFPEYGQESYRRIEKLKKVVAKCKRYGIKVYVFAIEPAALPQDLAMKYPRRVGYQSWNQRFTVCTYSEEGAAYCVESTKRLLELVPDLGGFINITDGERVTSCSSTDNFCKCPRCSQHSKGEILAHTVELFQEGIRQSGTNAEFISWTYRHRTWQMDDIKEYVRCAPEDAKLMENFEDAGYYTQLGKTRQAIDYWLSYTGPSQMFQGAAETAKQEGKRMFAKMQVCCSHELATVPYIPVPGILFDKYKAAAEYGVEGVVQCWYFGNYPSLMSKAAGELSFMEDFSDKKAFLQKLAGIYYGSRAEEATAAWIKFEESYRNYPINIMFSYYGPMHDGVVWELSLLPTNKPLPRSWLLMDKPDGDRIGECLQSGHTLEEAIELTNIMKSTWSDGVQKLPRQGPFEQRSIALALEILFASGNNILQFYQLRDLLGRNVGNSIAILEKMEKLVDLEIKNSEKMIYICEKDGRLGYHSEAEGYKFFPEKLLDRIEKLRLLKATEFKVVRERLDAGKSALDYYNGKNGSVYHMQKGKLKDAKYMSVQDEGAFRIAYDNENLYLELLAKESSKFLVCFEYRLMWPAPAIVIEDGKLDLAYDVYSHQSIFGDKIDKELEKYELQIIDEYNKHLIIKISRDRVGWIEDKPLKVKIEINDVSWIEENEPVKTLGKEDASPGQFGWLNP